MTRWLASSAAFSTARLLGTSAPHCHARVCTSSSSTDPALKASFLPLRQSQLLADLPPNNAVPNRVSADFCQRAEGSTHLFRTGAENTICHVKTASYRNLSRQPRWEKQGTVNAKRPRSVSGTLWWSHTKS